MNLESIKKQAKELMAHQSFDGMALGLIDFKTKSFSHFELIPNEFQEVGPVYFDLASLTKPLTLALSALVRPQLFSEEDLLLLLEHRSGLPIWGRLSHESWREEVLSFGIKSSDCAYSDFGALRLQLEIEKRINDTLYSLVNPLWDHEVCSWLDLPVAASFLPTGERKKSMIWGEVMDDNAYVIKSRVSHAGLFGTIKGVCQTLLNIDLKYELLSSLSSEIGKREGRFIRGWDTTRGNQDSLAGPGAGDHTFGHLGFTGTSIWIDPDIGRGYVLLTNATQNYWYDRTELNKMRRELGRAVWSI